MKKKKTGKQAISPDLAYLLEYVCSSPAETEDILRKCKGRSRLVAIYPGQNQQPPANGVLLGAIPDGALYLCDRITPQDLTGKTVFDFTDNGVLIYKATGINPKEPGAADCYKKHAHPANKAIGLINYAEFIGDTEMKAAAQVLAAQIRKKEEKRHKELEKKHPGIIID